MYGKTYRNQFSSAVKGNDLTLNDSNEPEFTTLGGSEFQMNGELTKMST